MSYPVTWMAECHSQCDQPLCQSVILVYCKEWDLMPKGACALNIEPSENVVHYNSYKLYIVLYWYKYSLQLFFSFFFVVVLFFLAQANVMVICLADLFLQMSNSACTGWLVYSSTLQSNRLSAGSCNKMPLAQQIDGKWHISFRHMFRWYFYWLCTSIAI